jgi:hypothetical protein
MRNGIGCLVAGMAAVFIVCPGWATAPPAKESRGKKPSSDEPGDARAVIDKAIEAAGGEEKLAHFKSQSWSEKGMFHGLGNPLPYMSKLAVEWPDKFRIEIPHFMTIVLNGERGWKKERDTTTEMGKAELAENLEERHTGYVTTLVPLRDKSFHLSLMKDAKIDGEPAVGVQVSHSGHRDVKLYFDKSTGLLAKSESRIKDLDHGGKDTDQETWYKNYKVVDGAKIPMKIVIMRDGKPYLEAENFALKAGAKLDPKLFEKPE